MILRTRIWTRRNLNDETKEMEKEAEDEQRAAEKKASEEKKED